jgi:hypothetical protein
MTNDVMKCLQCNKNIPLDDKTAERFYKHPPDYKYADDNIADWIDSMVLCEDHCYCAQCWVNIEVDIENADREDL